MSLAVAGRKGKQTLVYAGVNSKPDDVAKGTNEHLRAFGIEPSKGRSASNEKTTLVKVLELSRTSLFTDFNKDCYQRLVRVSGSVGATASSFADKPQIAVFEASGPKPKSKGVLELPRDAEAMDILQTDDNSFLVVYSHKYDLYLAKFIKGTLDSEPQHIYSISADEPQRPAFKNLRFLSVDFVLAVGVLPRNAGSVLQAFRLPSPGHEKARIAVSTRVPRKIVASSLAVTNLSPPTSPSASIGDTQFVVAVGGQDSSICLFTLSHRSASKIDLLYDLRELYTLKNVHKIDNITGLAFSTFVTPKANIRQQYIKLASISLQSSVAVHSIPLKKFVDPTPRSKNAPPRTPRYIVAMKSQTTPQTRSLFMVLAGMVVIMAIVGHYVLNYSAVARGHALRKEAARMAPITTPVVAQVQADVPLSQNALVKALGDDSILEGEQVVLFETLHAPEDKAGESVNKLQADVHDADIHGEGKTWEELPEVQQAAWKRRLSDAGAWTQSMGESVFKGILFGELGGAVHHAMGA